MKNSVLVLLAFILINNSSCAQKSENEVNEVENPPYTAELLVDEMEVPWGMAFLPDGTLLVTEKSGAIITFNNGQRNTLTNLPEVYERGQGGMLDIALHPDYENNGWIYLSYASEEGDEKGGNTAIMRAKLENNALTDHQVLYKATPNTTKGQHFGSRILFDNEGYLYFSIGERGDRDTNPQDIKRDGGKIYRLHDDGRIPEDNPFVGVDGAKSALYTYGNRNPQGLALHPNTGLIWEHEHGPRGGDEINIIKKGANYGWPLVTFGINYSGTDITEQTEKEGMESPIYYWTPSIAPSGMAFVTSDKYGEWEGSLLVGSLAFQYLERLELDGTKVITREKLMGDLGRIRDVKESPDGFIYVAVEGKGVYRLVPKEN